MKYRCLKEQEYKDGEYSLVSIRPCDIMLIMKWRNEQMDVLRQKALLTPETQRKYYEENVWNTFDMERPPQILFSYLKSGECIGYGGLVHISWEDKRAEVSFLLNTGSAKDEKQYDELFSTFLSVVKRIGFVEIGLNRLYTENFDIRDVHIGILERNGFKLEGRMRRHVRINNRFFDSLLHGILKEEYENHK